MALRIVGLLSLIIALSGASAYAQDADSAVVVKSAFGPIKPELRLHTRRDFMEAYRENDSALALIKWWFRRRDVGIVATSVGVMATSAGFIGYAANFFDNVALTVIPGPSKGVAVNGAVHVLFFGGITLTAIGGSEWKRFRLHYLRSVLQNPKQLSPLKWSRILGSTAQASTEPSALPSAKEQDEALRQQQEYWRKKGRTPPTPKQ